jgi:hypothetical protein
MKKNDGLAVFTALTIDSIWRVKVYSQAGLARGREGGKLAGRGALRGGRGCETRAELWPLGRGLYDIFVYFTILLYFPRPIL